MARILSLILTTLVVAGCNANKPPATQSGSPMLLETPANTQLLLALSAKGDQIYTIVTGPDGKPQWSGATPDARLFDDAGKQLGTHVKGPSWILTDSSTVVAELPPVKKVTADPAAVPWLELNAQPGSATGHLHDVTVIQRIHTTGGVPNPSDLTPANLGKTFRVRYTAEYLFFRPK